MLPLAILDTEGSVCGRINLNNIIRGAFQGASVGYWVSESRAGPGLATAAVTDVVGIGFTELGLSGDAIAQHAVATSARTQRLSAVRDLRGVTQDRRARPGSCPVSTA